MWPKALSQLVELAPHISRLVPVADRFLNARSASEEASRDAMQQMAEGLRGDLGQVTAAHAGLYRLLNAQSEMLSAVAADARTARLSADALEASVTRLERRVSRLFIMLAAALLLLAVLCILGIVILAHLR